MREIEKQKKDIIEKQRNEIIIHERQIELNYKEVKRREILEQKKQRSEEFSRMKNTMTEHKLIRSHDKIEMKLTKQVVVKSFVYN